MSKRPGRRRIALLAIFSFTTLALFLASLDVIRDPQPPGEGVPEMAAWLAKHPADWLTAAAISDGALDEPLPERRALWRASYELAMRLAPRRRNPSAAFVRGGLFHWYELDDAERRDVLAAAAPLMREPRFFSSVYRPLWQLTRDLGWLRAVAPETTQARAALRDLALAAGSFAEYRELRAEVQRRRHQDLERMRRGGSLAELIALLPGKLDGDDNPSVVLVLQELERRAVDSASVPRLVRVAQHALTHDLEPLGGLRPLAEAHTGVPPVLRARLALRMGRPDLAAQIELTNSSTKAPEWVPYFLERALYEARRGESAAADSYLSRAALVQLSDEVLAAAEETASVLGQPARAADYRRQLVERTTGRARMWQQTCGRDQLCNVALTSEYMPREGTIAIGLSLIESDETPPYVEIRLDGTRVAEGEVRGERRFEIPAAAGLHRIEVRLANRLTRNGDQRRLRLS